MDKQEPQLLCLRWNNHQANLVSVFDQLLQNEAFCDVTLAVDGRTVKCHQMVLCAASPWFQAIFMEKPCPHPIVFLKDMKYDHVRSLVEYIYYGEAAVPEDELQGLLKAAECLRIKGLVEMDDDKASKDRSQETSNSEPIRRLTPRKDLGGITTERDGAGSPQVQAPWRVRSPASISASVTGGGSSSGTSVKEEDAGELIIDEDTVHSDASGVNQSVTPIEVSPEYLGIGADDTPPAPGMIRVVGPNGKAEWKRYKQYTKDDIMAAIEDVKNGMSALQASRKYGVPSRTLYDKVKKMGILTANMQKQIQQKKQPPVPIQPATPGSAASPATSSSAGTPIIPPPINFLGLQVPQASLPVVNGHTNGGSASKFDHDNDIAASPVNPFAGAGSATAPPVSNKLMQAVMSMMSEKLKANGDLINRQNVDSLALASILQKNSQNSTGEGSDSGHSSGDPTDGDIAVKDEKGEGEEGNGDNKVLAATTQQLLAQLANINSLAAANKSIADTNNRTPVTLTPRLGDSLPAGLTAQVLKNSPAATLSAVSSSSSSISPGAHRSSSVITTVAAAADRKRKLSSTEKSDASVKDVSEVKKLLIEPAKQQAA